MKKVLKLCGVVLCLLLITGCMNMNVKVKVNANKSVDLNMKMEVNLLEYARTITSMNPDAKDLTEEELKQYVDENFNMESSDFIDEEELAELKKEGYKIEENFDKEKYLYDIVLTKHADNIDDISKLENEQKEDDSAFFIKTSKNTYKPNINVVNNDNNEELNDDEANDLEGISPIISSGMSASISYIFEVNLPNKPISHNATSVSSDGKTLIWTLNGNSNTNIDFEFAFVEEKKEENNNNNKSENSNTKKSFLDFNKEQLIAIAFIVGGLVTLITAIIAYVISNKKSA